MGIQRWDRRYEDMLWDDNGDFVLFTDHEQVVAELQAHFDECRSVGNDMIEQHEVEITRLRAELAAKSKDAARYVWLRDNAMNDGADWSDVPSLAWSGDITIDNTEIDQAIDSAMGEGNGR